jgi:hypothetical protein
MIGLDIAKPSISGARGERFEARYVPEEDRQRETVGVLFIPTAVLGGDGGLSMCDRSGPLGSEAGWSGRGLHEPCEDTA